MTKTSFCNTSSLLQHSPLLQHKFLAFCNTVPFCNTNSLPSATRFPLQHSPILHHKFPSAIQVPSCNAYSLLQPTPTAASWSPTEQSNSRFFPSVVSKSAVVFPFTFGTGSERVPLGADLVLRKRVKKGQRALQSGGSWSNASAKGAECTCCPGEG